MTQLFRSFFHRIFALILCFSLVFSLIACGKTNGEKSLFPMELPSAICKVESATPGVEYPRVVKTATLGVTGDILIHDGVYKAAQKKDGTYDFSDHFSTVKPYFERYDYMVANLEVTLGGENPQVGEYPSSYPRFNCPDAIVDGLKGAGVDMLLTANNHSNDTAAGGIYRTLEVVREKGLETLGTKKREEENSYLVKDINGIKIGMACFTYATTNANGTRSLNGLPLTKKTSPLVSTFDYNDLASFYKEAEKALSYMEQEGASYSVFYIHWGNEYQYSPSTYQTKMAKRLCEMGVDVIVGGHPHVIQPFETITAENGNETLCIYSVGNTLSNQRKQYMDSDNYSGHTEDGMIFGVTFEKWSDGVVSIGGVEILPLWVDCANISGKREFRIIPLDLSLADWKSLVLTTASLNNAKASYERTLALVGKGLNEYRAKKSLDPVPLVVS